MLKKNRHFNKRLQASYNKYGHESFTWNILKLDIELDDLIPEEQLLLNNLFDDPNNYNMARFADNPSRGVKATPYQRMMMSIQRRGEGNGMWGKKHRPESKKLISKANKGKGTGRENPNYNHRVFMFIYRNTGEVIECTMNDFIKEKNFDRRRISDLVRGVKPSYKNWSVVI